MEGSTIFAIVSISIGVLYIIINTLKDKIKELSYRKGYEDGEIEVVRSLKSTAFWFNAPEHKGEFNALMLYSMLYQKYGSVDSDLFRKRIDELGNRKLKDLSTEEIENLIR
ncbi:hypothetical protein ACMGDK_11580 [Chryseobacterium sp. DT-3]|uniref:hypothetical protein n=1 Tax=Chryseobacterium sp. DT-3 TaxID=3396164 RepID=UPI003F192DC2